MTNVPEPDEVKFLAKQILGKLDTVESLLQEIRLKADRLAVEEKAEKIETARVERVEAERVKREGE